MSDIECKLCLVIELLIRKFYQLDIAASNNSNCSGCSGVRSQVSELLAVQLWSIYHETD